MAAVTEQPRRYSGTPSPSASPLHRRFLGTPEHSDNNSDAGRGEEGRGGEGRGGEGRGGEGRGGEGRGGGYDI